MSPSSCSHRGRREKSDRQRQPQQQQPKTRIKRGWNIEEEEEWIPTRFLLKPTCNVCLELFENVSSLHPCWLEVWLLSHTTFSLHSVWYDGILFCYIKQLDETPPDPNHVVILTHFLHSTSLLTGPYWTNHRWHQGQARGYGHITRQYLIFGRTTGCQNFQLEYLQRHLKNHFAFFVS